jgi:DNA repair photolyase
MFGPLLPWLSDDERSLAEMFARAADLDIGTIWVDALNPRPRVWPAVAELLRREFPDLRERYSRMLFDKTSRAEYLGSLNNRLNEAAKRAGISGRIHGIG